MKNCANLLRGHLDRMNKKNLGEADIRTKFITPALVGPDGLKWNVLTQIREENPAILPPSANLNPPFTSKLPNSHEEHW